MLSTNLVSTLVISIGLLTQALPISSNTGSVNVASTLERRAGKATYYAVGLGNCGQQNTDSEMVVAIAQPDVAGDTTSQCGKTVSITNLDTNQVTQAKVVDLCPGCSSGSLDMSPATFKALGGTEEQGVFPMSYTIGG